MAMEVTSRVVHDGARNVIMQFTGRSDGSGQETSVVKVDVSELDPPCQSVKVLKVSGDVSYGLVRLYWDAQIPREIVIISTYSEFDYRKNAGLTNPLIAEGDDSATGDITLSTEAFEAGSSYSVLLEMVKKYAA